MDPGRRTQWLRGVLEMCVMALLAGRPAYGYQLCQALADHGLDGVKGGTLYPLLLRLERLGLVTAEWASGEAGPARKYYRLTPEGERALRRQDGDWRTFASRVDGLLAPARVGEVRP
jgi:PadR family transcriptional regulator PadR